MQGGPPVLLMICACVTNDVPCVSNDVQGGAPVLLMICKEVHPLLQRRYWNLINDRDEGRA